ncbi:MAG: DUF3617 domain-containing protein [Sphingomonas sp.]|nr:DUF3617 domain-containing protein [Sphingomonas sp.]MBW0006771.1 DUF3617 domain-containing protein [Sphingomonas sp.]
MKHLLLLAAGLAALTACNKSPTVDAKNATPEEVAKQVRASGVETAFVTPGEWTSKVTIVSMHVPGAPPAMEAQMKGRGSEERNYCLTPEEAKKPNENFFAGNQNECRYDHFTMGGGKIDAAMRCTHEKMTQLVTFNGSYAPNSYQVAMDSKVVGGSSEMAGMAMSMRVDAKRVGECSPKRG